MRIEALQQLFIEKGKKLGVAESCTGGHISSKITSIPGASRYFVGSIVAYDNQVKMDILDVSPTTLATHGAVSQEVALEMAEGTLKRLKCDIALVITGIAGPEGGSLEKPVGTVWFAICQSDGEVRAWSLHLEGSRKQVIDCATITILEECYIMMKKWES